MKKALSAVLAMLMVLSCMVILPTVAAEEASSEKKVFLSNCDSFDGWPGFEGKGGTVDTANKTEGTGSISINVAGKTTSGAGRFAYEWSKGSDLDITGMNRVVFDLYVSDVEFLDTKFELEFRVKATCAHSSNHCDCNELHVSANPLKTFIVGTPKTGWNRIEIPMSSFGEAGTVPRDRITYMRMFMPSNTNTSFGVDGKTYTLKLDNFHFTDRQTAYAATEGFDVVINDADSRNNWSDNTVEGGNVTGRPAYELVAVEGRGNVMQTTYTGTLYANGGYSGPNGDGKFPTYGMQIQYKGAPVDVTGMKYFTFWMYVSDPDALANTKVFLEVFSNNIDNEEISAALTFAQMKGKALTKGWNYISVDLAMLTGKSGTFNPSRFVGFRFFNADKLELGSKKLTVAFDTLGFAKEKYNVVAPDAYVPVPASLISVIDGETLDGFATGDQLVLDYNDPYQGNSSIARTFEGVVNSNAFIKFEYTMPNGKTYDATEIQRLCFDLYLSSAAAFENAGFELELRGNGDDDNTETRWETTLGNMKGEDLVDGWNHFEIPLSSMTVKNANMAEYNYFRLFLRGDLGGAGLEGVTSTIKLDNVYLSATPVVYEDKIPLPMTLNGNATAGKLSPSWGSGSYMVQFLSYKNNPVDIREMTWFEFDVLIGDARMNNNKFRIDITSTGGSDNGQLCTSGKTLTEMTGTTIPVGEWTHVRIPLNVFNSSTQAGSTTVAHDPTKVNYIRFFNNQTNTADTATYGFEVKNFALTKDLSSDTELYIWDVESTAQFVGGRTDAIVPSKGVNFGDVDGDGDNEYIVRQYQVNDPVKQYDGGKEQIVLNFKNDTYRLENVGYADMTAIRFDLYTSNEKYLDATVNFEATSVGGCDHSEINANIQLRNHVIEDKGNGWYTIEIKLSALGSSNPGKHAPFMPARFNFIRWYSNSVVSWGADEDMIVAVDDFYLIREGVTNDENAFEIPAGAITLPISSKPIVNLVAGGSYPNTGSSQNPQSFAATDISGNNLLFAELELKNYGEFADAVWCIELTSSGKCDVNEYSTSKPLRTIFTRVDGQALQDGKQWVYADLNSSIWANQGGKADFTNINYIRIFNQTKPITVTANSTAILSNFFVTNEETMDISTANSVDFTGVSLNVNESLAMTFTANIHPSLSDVTMTVNFNDRDYILEGERVGTTSKVLFTFNGIMPYQMAETITASLMAMTPDGRLLTDAIENYSVKQYCLNLLAALESGELYDGTRALAPLLVEVLYYGAAVLNYTDEEADVEKFLEGVDLSLRNTFYSPASCAGLVGEQGDCPAAFTTVSAVLGSSYALRVNIKADSLDEMTLLVSDGREVTEITEFEAAEAAGEFYVDIPVSAFRIDDAYTFSFKGYEGYSLNYSFGTYIDARTAELDPTDAEYVLLDAIVAYSTASRAYVEAVR